MAGSYFLPGYHGCLFKGISLLALPDKAFTLLKIKNPPDKNETGLRDMGYLDSDNISS